MADSTGSFLGWLGQALAVALGWYVVHRLSAARDIEKARRELVAKSADSLSDSLNDLLSEAREYHLKHRNVSAELKIKITIQDLIMRTNALSDLCNHTSLLTHCRSDISKLRRVITGKHFEDEHQKPLLENDTQFEEMGEAIFKVKQSLLNIKVAQFKKTR